MRTSASRWVIVLTAVIVTVVGLISYPVVVEVVRFEAHRQEMINLIQNASPENRNLPDPVRSIFLFELMPSLNTYAMRQLINKFNRDGLKRQSDFNTASFAWYPLTILHFSVDDRLTIIATLAPTGNGRLGLTSTSLDLFGRPLSRLSIGEAATIVALVANPSLAGSREQLRAARDRLLSRYRARTH